MARVNMYDDEMALPYWVRLAKAGGDTYGSNRDPQQVLMHLDLRGGEFTRASHERLTRTFDWLTRMYRVNIDRMVEHYLVVTPLDPVEDFKVIDERTSYRPEDWPTRQGRSFLWIPIAYDTNGELYAWQR